MQNELQNIISFYQGQPSSKIRNKIISKLEDAQVWMSAYGQVLAEPSVEVSMMGFKDRGLDKTGCICPIGGRSTDCTATVHGGA